MRDATAFHVERNTKPEKWYPKDSNRKVQTFEDAPSQHQANINSDPPFGVRG